MHKRNKKQIIQSIFIAILTLIVIGMSVGFASYSAKLNITGTANVAENKWSIRFLSEGMKIKPGLHGENIFTSAKVDSLATTVNFTAKLNKVDSASELIIPIVNDGTFDAVLKSAEITGISAEQANYILVAAVVLDTGGQVLGAPYVSIAPEQAQQFQPIPVPANQKQSAMSLAVLVKFIQPEDPKLLPNTDQEMNISVKFNFEQA